MSDAAPSRTEVGARVTALVHRPLEFGPGGARSVEAGPGEFFYVPPATIHFGWNVFSPEAGRGSCFPGDGFCFEALLSKRFDPGKTITSRFPVAQ